MKSAKVYRLNLKGYDRWYRLVISGECCTASGSWLDTVTLDAFLPYCSLLCHLYAESCCLPLHNAFKSPLIFHSSTFVQLIFWSSSFSLIRNHFIVLTIQPCPNDFRIASTGQSEYSNPKDPTVVELKSYTSPRCQRIQIEDIKNPSELYKVWAKKSISNNNAIPRSYPRCSALQSESMTD